MKRCPRCNRVETDDVLVFCRTDGTALISDSGSGGTEAGTVKFVSAPVSSEIETSVLPHTATTPEINRPAGPTTMVPAQPIPGATQALSKPKKPKAIIAIAAVVTVALIAGAFLYWPRTKKAAPIESIAVMPFVNQNNDANIDYLADGIPENIINSLSQLPNLKVMSRNSVFQYKGKAMDAQAVAKELRVQAVLTGRVTQRAGEFQAQLLRDLPRNLFLYRK